MFLFINCMSSLKEPSGCEIVNTDFIRNMNIWESSNDGTLFIQIWFNDYDIETDPNEREWVEYEIKKEDKFYFLEQLKNLGLR